MKIKPSTNLLIPASIFLAIALAACGGKNSDESKNESKPEPATSSGVWEQIQQENTRGDETYAGIRDILGQL